MELKIIKLNESAIIPRYAHSGDAGLDLFAIEEQLIPPGETQLVKTGIAIALPPETEAQIRPRSGLALKHSVTVLNSPGTIDAGYRGEIGIILINHGKKGFPNCSQNENCSNGRSFNYSSQGNSSRSIKP